MGEESGRGAAFDGLPVAWEHTGDGDFPYRATVDGVELLVQINNFPAEPLSTLLVNGQVAEDLEDWPAQWVRPSTPAHLLRAVGSRDRCRELDVPPPAPALEVYRAVAIGAGV